MLLDFNAHKKANFSTVFCEHDNSTTIACDQWWSNYYSSIKVPKDTILTKTTNKIALVLKDDPKKTKGSKSKKSVPLRSSLRPSGILNTLG